MEKNNDVECNHELDVATDQIAKLIKEYRAMRGMSLSQVERMTNVSSSFINRIENGERNEISFSKLIRIAVALGIPFELLIEKSFDELKQKDDNKSGILTLTDLLIQNEFTINDKKIEGCAKRFLLDIMEFIVDCKWDAMTKIHDLYLLSKRIEKFKAI
ncbi:helix-turn-helix domain-containing protein [Neobacillus sp. D3-1R]|uniref:helix-turn-helix domain-containing protein n=1 Tax=Neobacillus sp. D3-1R TaxID=3445778 RepID=UPI003F9FCA50